MRRVLLVLALLVTPGLAAAQAVETPVPFDSAGRVWRLTPPAAAQLQLRPPAWRVTGDFREARLYALGNEGYVIVVTRPSGLVERYAVTEEERQYLMARTAALPPGIADQLGDVARQAVRSAEEGISNSAFVRNQALILGPLVYGPTFAYAISDETAARVAGYLIVAGGTFFAASEVARRIPISSSQNLLATHMGVVGGGVGLSLLYALDAGEQGIAAGGFVASIGGTAAGLYLGDGLSVGEAAATAFGAEVAGGIAAGIISAIDSRDGEDVDARTAYALVAGSALLGYPLGFAWARRAPYNITAGDVGTLYSTGGVGALAFTALGGNSRQWVRWTLATAGFGAGVVAGNWVLVRRFDHTGQDAVLIGGGALAGSLMGAGISILIDRDDDVLPWALASIGGMTGIALAQRYAVPQRDIRLGRAELRFHPEGLMLSAVRARGNHPVVSVGF